MKLKMKDIGMCVEEPSLTSSYGSYTGAAKAKPYPGGAPVSYTTYNKYA